MLGSIIICKDIDNINFEGIVELVYQDALASGEKDYIQVTYLLVKETNGSKIHIVRPREVSHIIK